MDNVYVSLSGAAGYMGRNHLKKILKLQSEGRCKLAGVCDPKLADPAHEYHTTLPDVKRYRRFDEMIDMRTPGRHLVVIASPTRHHAEQSMCALRSDNVAAVLCEKPVAEYSAQAENLKEEQKYSKKPLMTAFVEHFNPAFRRAKELLPEIGSVEIVTARRIRPPIEPERIHGHEPSTDVSFDCGVHDIANLLDLYAETGFNGVKITGHSSEFKINDQNPGKDFFTGIFDVSIGRKPGFRLDMMDSFLGKRKYRVTTFRGSAGELQVDYVNNTVRLITPERSAEETVSGDSLEIMYESVLAQVVGNRPYPVGLGIASGSIAIIENMRPYKDETSRRVDTSLEFWV